ncbi:MAG: hypothetical protein ACRCZG_02890, partial [Culicoidibacterales bacterium]
MKKQSKSLFSMRKVMTTSAAAAMLATTIAPTIQVFAYEAPTKAITNVEPAVQTYEQQKQNAASTVRNVMYYGDWSIWGGQGNFYPKDIPADQLTHLNFAF